jgi:hypothetical protein
MTLLQQIYSIRYNRDWLQQRLVRIDLNILIYVLATPSLLAFVTIRYMLQHRPL